MTTCHEVGEVLEEYRRGELPAESARSVEVHLAQCPTCRQRHDHEAALAAMLRSLPRPAAAPALRRRVRQALTPRRRWLGRPWAAAAVAAILVAAALSPWVRLREERPPDPVETLVASGVAEHRRILLQLQSGRGDVSDAGAALSAVRAATEVPLPPAFAGDAELRLVDARPTLLANRKAAAAVLRYQTRSVTTYFALAGKDLPMPSERRVQIEQYRPYMRPVNGFHVVYWKQGDLAYLMVSDQDDAGTRELFLRMRKAL